MALLLLYQEHNFLEKLKPKPERVRFDRGSVELPSIDDGAKFISSFSFTPGYVQPMWEKQKHVTSSDFAHGNPKHGCVFGERVSRDGNHNVILHSMVVYVGNESEEAHVVLNEATRDGNEGFDHPLTMDNSDADKGGAAGFKAVFERANQRLDFLHRVNTISETPAANGGGAVGVEFYKKAFAEHDAAQDRVPSWKSSRPEPVPRGGAGRRRDRQHVEFPLGKLEQRGA